MGMHHPKLLLLKCGSVGNFLPSVYMVRLIAASIWCCLLLALLARLDLSRLTSCLASPVFATKCKKSLFFVFF